jgi:hypothetical protein
LFCCNEKSKIKKVNFTFAFRFRWYADLTNIAASNIFASNVSAVAVRKSILEIEIPLIFYFN